MSVRINALFVVAACALPHGAAFAEGTNNCPPAQIEHNEELIWRLAEADLDDPQVMLKATGDLIHPDYIQHNPFVAHLKGRQGVEEAFLSLIKQGISARYAKPALVLANCNYVAAMIHFKRPEPDQPTTTYDSYWFDIWRIEDGKLIEHWDQTIKGLDYQWDVVLPLNGLTK
jgi:predicted SnoaL-like aldol condensation-catalyzing enzyme